MDRRVICSGLRLGDRKMLAVQRPAFPAGALRQGGHKLIFRYPRGLVRGLLRFIVEVIGLSADHSFSVLIAGSQFPGQLPRHGRYSLALDQPRRDGLTQLVDQHFLAAPYPVGEIGALPRVRDNVTDQVVVHLCKLVAVSRALLQVEHLPIIALGEFFPVGGL